MSCGGLFLMTNICREMGKRLEDKLYRDWGGKPTTQLLRHRDGIIDSVTKRRYHAFLAAKINSTFPDAEQEKRRSGQSRRSIPVRSALASGSHPARDGKKFDLLFRDNVTYGFRRNALGARPLGIVIAIGCLLWVLTLEGVLFGASHRLIDITAVSLECRRRQPLL